MILLAAMTVLLVVVALGVGGFILLEALALRKSTDDLLTFSTYWKLAKTLHPGAKVTLNIVVTLLCLILVFLAVWLFGHLVLEAW
jgi:hypothetical protein